MRCLISLSFLFHLGNTQAWKGAPSSSREVEGGAASLSTVSSIVVKPRQAWTTHLPLRMTSKTLLSNETVKSLPTFLEGIFPCRGGWGKGRVIKAPHTKSAPCNLLSDRAGHLPGAGEP